MSPSYKQSEPTRQPIPADFHSNLWTSSCVTSFPSKLQSSEKRWLCIDLFCMVVCVQPRRNPFLSCSSQSSFCPIQVLPVLKAYSSPLKSYQHLLTVCSFLERQTLWQSFLSIKQVLDNNAHFSCLQSCSIVDEQLSLKQLWWDHQYLLTYHLVIFVSQTVFVSLESFFPPLNISGTCN